MTSRRRQYITVLCESQRGRDEVRVFQSPCLPGHILLYLGEDCQDQHSP